MLKILTSRKHDSIGFWIYGSPVLNIAVHYWPLWQYKLPGFLVRADLGGGAGSRYGATFYLGFKVRGGGYHRLYTRTKGVCVGITRNANAIPCHFA